MDLPVIRMLRTLLTAAAFVSLFAASVSAQGDSEKLYKSKCATCHGVDGKGDTPVGKKLGARDFGSPEVQKETDDELIEITTKGKNKMPAYGKSLKPDEIKGLVTYIRGMAKK